MGQAARKAPTVQRDMQKELAAATALKEQLKQFLGEEHADAITLRDSIEGETDLFEIIDKVALQIGEDDSRAEGIAALQRTLASRKSRLEERADGLRTMLTNALDILGERKLERPIATISLKIVPPKLIVTDEAAVPSTYWNVPEPVLARKDLTDALKARKSAMDELADRNQRGEIGEEQLDVARAEIEATHPAIPGADLDNGGVSVQLRFG